jgi:hypothetical protein
MNKRIFDQRSIGAIATTSTYEEFCRYMSKTEICLFRDEWSYSFYSQFIDNNEDARINLYTQIRNEN